MMQYQLRNAEDALQRTKSDFLAPALKFRASCRAETEAHQVLCKEFAPSE